MASQELQDAADRLSAAIEAAEELIRETFATYASVPLPNAKELFTRKSGLFVRDFTTAPASELPATHAAVAIRIDVAGAIPALWQALTDAESRKIAEAQTAALALEAFLAEKIGP